MKNLTLPTLKSELEENSEYPEKLGDEMTYPYEKEIVWFKNPLWFKFLREAVRLYNPRKKMKDDQSHIIIGLAVHYTLKDLVEHNIAPDCLASANDQRYWYLSPWDLPGHHWYTGNYTPIEAVDPASVKAGKESKKFYRSDLASENVDQEMAIT